MLQAPMEETPHRAPCCRSASATATASSCSCSSPPPIEIQIERAHTFGEVIDGELARRIARQMAQRDIRLALADHKVHHNQRLEDNRPGAVAQPVLQHAEHLGDALLARVRRHENVLDILGLGRGKLRRAQYGPC